MKKRIRRLQAGAQKRLFGVSAAFAIVGFVLLLTSGAAALIHIIEPEDGDRTAITVVDDASASSGKAILFARQSPSPSASSEPSATPTPSPTSSVTYQANLTRIFSASYRNTTAESSSYLDTASASLPLSNFYASWDTYNNAEEDKYFQGSNTVAGEWRTFCEFSHFAYDDPFQFPGQPGASHLNMFFGNTRTNALSTYETLINSGGSTCNGHEVDRTAYWVPALLDAEGNPRMPNKILVYYKNWGTYLGNEQWADPGKSEYYPDNLQLYNDGSVNEYEGEASSNHVLNRYAYRCTSIFNDPNGAKQYTMPNCVGEANGWNVLEFNSRLPQCWNGQDPSKRENLTVPTSQWRSNDCPASHPKIFAGIEFRVFYPLEAGVSTQNWFLSSDVNKATGAITSPRGSTHQGSWWGAWNKDVNKIWTDNCANKKITDPECYTGRLMPATNTALKLRHQYNGPFKINAQQVLTDLCPASKTAQKPGDAAYCL